jgi:hypothetical protein
MYYGLESLKSEGMLAIEITENDHQHPPHLDFARPEQKELKQILRIKQSLGFIRSGMHKRYFKTFPPYLGFRVASAAVFTH